MWRGTLATFLKRLVVAAPLVAGAPMMGCSSPCETSRFLGLLDGGYPTDADIGHQFSLDECTAMCPDGGLVLNSCEVSWEQDNNGRTLKMLECVYNGGPCHTGRRPAGLQPARVEGDDVGAWLARSAHLEAASVAAFERLAVELAAHGAPARFIASARIAATDEERHARATGALARRCGAVVPRVEIAPVGPRTLLEIALENEAEGCVGESWGALVALHQAANAGDPAIRRAMAGIAEDEIRHAELAFQVAAWARTRLPLGEAEDVSAMRELAATRLRNEAAVDPGLAVRRAAGLPDADQAVRYADRLAQELWS